VPAKMMLATALLAALAAGCASMHFSGSAVRLADSNSETTAVACAGADVSGKQGYCEQKVCALLPLFVQDLTLSSEEEEFTTTRHPAIHGPYSLLLAGDFVAPSTDRLDDSYGIETRFMVRTIDHLFLGCSIGYGKTGNEDAKGLIEGEIHRYTGLFWAEYRLNFGRTTWSPSLDFGMGPGWYVGEPFPLSERREAIESLNRDLHVGVVSTMVFRMAAQLRLPVLRSTDISISEGNADLIIGIGGDFGKGTARYTITDPLAGIKTVSKGALALDSFHVFLGLSFRF
jgi:hypothetical protein